MGVMFPSLSLAENDDLAMRSVRAKILYLAERYLKYLQALDFNFRLKTC